MRRWSTRPGFATTEPSTDPTITASGASKPVRRSLVRGSTSSDAPQPRTSNATKTRYGSSWNGSLTGSVYARIGMKRMIRISAAMRRGHPIISPERVVDPSITAAKWPALARTRATIPGRRGYNPPAPRRSGTDATVLLLPPGRSSWTYAGAPQFNRRRLAHLLLARSEVLEEECKTNRDEHHGEKDDCRHRRRALAEDLCFLRLGDLLDYHSVGGRDCVRSLLVTHIRARARSRRAPRAPWHVAVKPRSP